VRIPVDRYPEILKRAGAGESSDAIAEWLGTVGVTVSGRAVRGLLERTRTERGDAAKVAARQVLAPVITSDLAALDDIIRRARAIEERASEDEATKRPADPRIALKALALQAKVLDRKLHYSGAGETDGDTAAKSLADFLAKGF
jgi:hypothetical protein